MALLLGVDGPPQEPLFGPRGTLRSSGVRRPWMPGPLAALTTPMLRAAAVATVVAATALPGGGAVWMPRPPLDPGGAPPPSDPIRPAAIVVNRPAAPDPIARWLTAPRDQAAPTFDRLALTPAIAGPQPTPAAPVWQPAPPRLPNSDPLRPPAVMAEPPDATLQQPIAAVVGRLPRPEDANWPARRAIVVGVPVPTPGPALWQPAPARLPNSDPLRPTAVDAAPPDATLQQPGLAWVGRLPRPEDSAWPARPAPAMLGQQPTPAAPALWLTAPRETVVAPPGDPIRPLSALLGAQITPSPLALWLTVPREAAAAPPSDPIRPLTPLVGAQPAPAAAAAWLTALRVAPPDPIRPWAPIVGAAPAPLGRASWLTAPRDTVAPTFDRLALTPAIVGPQPTPRPAALLTAPPRPAQLERLAITQLRSGPQPTPLALALALRAPRDEVAPPARLRALIAVGEQRPHALRAGLVAWLTAPHDDPTTVVGLVHLTGARSAELHGARDTGLTGARDAELTGARDTNLTGRRGRRLTKR